MSRPLGSSDTSEESHNIPHPKSSGAGDDSLDLEAATLRIESPNSKAIKHDNRSDRSVILRTESNPDLVREILENEKNDVILVTFDENDPLNPKVLFELVIC